MKIRLLYFFFFGALCFTILPGNKNGRASEAKRGNTGAPGDETNTNGSPRTCNYCHFGAAGPVVFIHLLDENGDTLTQYTPGHKYKARVLIQNTNPNLIGYGFQMIALRNADSTDLDGFSDPGNNTVNNYKIATIANGRTYAEHDNISNANQFEVVWTAPPAGTGPVTFYAAGNAVNRNGTSSGDGAAHSSLEIGEDLAASTNNWGDNTPTIRVWPNPTTTNAMLQVELPWAGNFQIRVFDSSGRLVWAAKQELFSGQNRVDLPAAAWAPGVYRLEISNAGHRQTATLARL